ncbi:MAG TPA: ABC transporter ATP-binding protein [bacterium]|nr:ABC transporter ATP-binding protein [bacterium]
MPLLEVRGLEKSYRIGQRPVPILRGLDLQLEAGERLCLVGASGEGKSTLLHLIAGLDRADGGSIRIEGQELGQRRAAELAELRRRSLGIVFQFFNLFPSLSLLDNVLLPATLDGRPRRESEDRARALMERSGIWPRRRARANEASGGELQRAALCRALLNRPALLLADEPTGNLDSQNRRRVYELLGDLCREQGCGLLLVTHDEAAIDWTDRRWVLRGGKAVPA